MTTSSLWFQNAGNICLSGWKTKISHEPYRPNSFWHHKNSKLFVMKTHNAFIILYLHWQFFCYLWPFLRPNIFIWAIITIRHVTCLCVYMWHHLLAVQSSVPACRLACEYTCDIINWLFNLLYLHVECNQVFSFFFDQEMKIRLILKIQNANIAIELFRRSIYIKLL